MTRLRILTLNSGSSSLKFSVYEIGGGEEALLLRGKLERIGSEGGHVEAYGANHERLLDLDVPLPDHARALQVLMEQLPAFQVGRLSAVGHRIVQGGPHHLEPVLATPERVQELHALCPMDPPHLPAALQDRKSVV